MNYFSAFSPKKNRTIKKEESWKLKCWIYYGLLEQKCLLLMYFDVLENFVLKDSFERTKLLSRMSGFSILCKLGQVIRASGWGIQVENSIIIPEKAMYWRKTTVNWSRWGCMSIFSRKTVPGTLKNPQIWYDSQIFSPMTYFFHTLSSIFYINLSAII